MYNVCSVYRMIHAQVSSRITRRCVTERLICVRFGSFNREESLVGLESQVVLVPAYSLYNGKVHSNVIP